MKNILVASDGSDYAKKALDVAITLAKSSDSSVIIFHGTSRRAPNAAEREMVQMEYSEALMSRLRWRQPSESNAAEFASSIMAQQVDITDAVRAILSENIIAIAAKHARESGIEKVDSITRTGDVADNILQVAEEKKIDQIVMGTRGLSDLKGLLMGSVSHRVAHKAKCDIILVK